MILLPAIDILDGKCVQLTQGDYTTSREVAGDPFEAAVRFKTAGARWVHMVDLDGARTGAGINREICLRIADQSGLKVELGGGIRDMDTIDFLLSHGIARIVLGTVAVREPDLVAAAAKKYGDKIAVGIDARGGGVMVEGWQTEGGLDFIAFARIMEACGVGALIYTDIVREGMLGGVDPAPLRQLKDAVSCHIVASGGIRGMDDIRALAELDIYGAICGTAVYSGDLDLAQAIAYLGEQG